LNGVSGIAFAASAGRRVTAMLNAIVRLWKRGGDGGTKDKLKTALMQNRKERDGTVYPSLLKSVALAPSCPLSKNPLNAHLHHARAYKPDRPGGAVRWRKYP
jgi:hypothetical protein